MPPRRTQSRDSTPSYIAQQRAEGRTAPPVARAIIGPLITFDHALKVYDAACEDEEDPYVTIAAAALDLPPSHITDRERETVKRELFGHQYGVGAGDAAFTRACAPPQQATFIPSSYAAADAAVTASLYTEIPNPESPMPNDTTTTEPRFPDGFRFHPPYTAAHEERGLCLCVNCGREARGIRQIRSYPHEFIPDDWAKDSRRGALHCPNCQPQPQPGATVVALGYSFWERYDTTQRATRNGVTLHHTRRATRPVDTNHPAIEAPKTKDTAMNPIETKKTPKTKKPLQETIADEAKELGAAALLGGQLAVIDQSGEVLLTIFKVLVARAPALAGLLETQDGRELAKLVVASSLSAVARNTDLFPAGEAIAAVTDLQVTLSTYKLVNPHLATVRQQLEILAGYGVTVLKQKGS